MDSSVPRWIEEAIDGAGIPEVIHAAEMDSTNRRALEWAAAGAPDRGIVVADFQTAGRGRHRRRWESEPGLNVLVSWIVRASKHPELLPLVAGMAVLDVVDHVAPGRDARVKWPNDVLVAGRKIAGVLVESRASSGKVDAVVGVGLNVNQHAFGVPATSLSLESGRPVQRAEALGRLLLSLRGRLDDLGQDREAFLASYRDRMAGVGQPVTVRLAGDDTIQGILEGIDRAGALLIRTPTGIRRYFAADVTIGSEPT